MSTDAISPTEHLPAVARGALEAASQALDDWLHTYASEFCNAERVRQSYERIAERGTIGYIAQVQQRINEVLKA